MTTTKEARDIADNLALQVGDPHTEREGADALRSLADQLDAARLVNTSEREAVKRAMDALDALNWGAGASEKTQEMLAHDVFGLTGKLDAARAECAALREAAVALVAARTRTVRYDDSAWDFAHTMQHLTNLLSRPTLAADALAVIEAAREADRSHWNAHPALVGIRRALAALDGGKEGGR